MKHKVSIVHLQEFSSHSAAREIFDLVWAIKFGTEITSNLLQAMIHSGSYLSGALIDGQLVGAAFAFPAVNDGLHLHSHMTAVLPEYRDQGVGYALKMDQWNWARRNDYPYLSWTFDPLVRRNAKLNVVKLGVEISAYYSNFYGEMPDSLNTGDESDRLIANPEPSDILIEIPEDIVAIRSKDQIESIKWRRQVREQFMAAFAKNGKVIGFSTNSEYVVRI